MKMLVQGMRRRYYWAAHVRRPLGVPTVEDGLLLGGARILPAIYDAHFVDYSCGFRSGRAAHPALVALRNEVTFGGTEWVYEVDIRGFFDHLDQDRLMQMLELRTCDPWILNSSASG